MASTERYDMVPPPERLRASIGKHTEEYVLYRGLGAATSDFVCVLIHGWLGSETLYPVARTLQGLNFDVAVVGQKRRPTMRDVVAPNAQRSRTVHAVTKHVLEYLDADEVLYMAHSNGQQDAIHAAQQAAKIKSVTGVAPYAIRGIVGVAGVGLNGKKVHPWELHHDVKEQLASLSRNPDKNMDIIRQSLQNLLSNPPRSAVEAMGAMIYDGRAAATELVESNIVGRVDEYYFSHDIVIPPPDDCSTVTVLDGTHLTPLIEHEAWVMAATNMAA